MNNGGRIRSRSGQRTPRKRTARKGRKTKTDGPAARFFVFTIDADNAEIVKVERLGQRGERRELSEEDKTKLLQGQSDDRLEDMLERTFEAGIACALGNETADAGKPETDEDAELRHLLLARLIEHSDVPQILRSGALTRGFLGALIQHSINSAPIVRAH